MRKLILMLAFFGVGQLAAAEIEFIANNVSAARIRAAKEGKLILLNFYAEYCPSCKIMDQSTWLDSTVVNTVAKNCIATKIDLQSEHGATYESYFDVRRLPTIMLLDACGNEIVRYENTVTASRMVDWLNSYSVPEYRACPEGAAVAFPPIDEPFVSTGDLSGDPLASSTLEATNTIIAPDSGNSESEPVESQQDSEPALLQQEEEKPKIMAIAPQQEPEDVNPQQQPSSGKRRWPHIFRPSKKKQEDALATNTPVFSDLKEDEAPSKPLKPEETQQRPSEQVAEYSHAREDGLLTASEPNHVVWEAEKTGFSVQVLASSSAEKALEWKKNCLDKFKKPVAVISPIHGGDTYYRVVVGMFGTKAEAEKFKAQVRKTYADAFVKDLTVF